MKFKIIYGGNPAPDPETVEADDHAVDGTWIVFKRYVEGHGGTTVLRVKADKVDRVELLP